MAVNSQLDTPISFEEIRWAQGEDDGIHTVIQYQKAGAPPDKSDLRSLDVRRSEGAFCTVGFVVNTR